MWASPFVGVGTCLRRGLLSWVESAPFLLSAAGLSSAPLSQVLRQSHLQGGLYVVAWSCKPDKSLLRSARARVQEGAEFTAPGRRRPFLLFYVLCCSLGFPHCLLCFLLDLLQDVWLVSECLFPRITYIFLGTLLKLLIYQVYFLFCSW